MPGDLRGVDSSNGEYILKSYGYAGCRIKDNAGNILKLPQVKQLPLSFRSIFITTAPQSIPYGTLMKQCKMETGPATATQPWH